MLKCENFNTCIIFNNKILFNFFRGVREKVPVKLKENLEGEEKDNWSDENYLVADNNNVEDHVKSTRDNKDHHHHGNIKIESLDLSSFSASTSLHHDPVYSKKREDLYCHDNSSSKRPRARTSSESAEFTISKISKDRNNAISISRKDVPVSREVLCPEGKILQENLHSTTGNLILSPNLVILILLLC